MPQIIKSRNSILLEFNSPILFCFLDFDTASEHPSLVADTCRKQQTYSKILYFLFPFPILCVRFMGRNVQIVFTTFVFTTTFLTSYFSIIFSMICIEQGKKHKEPKFGSDRAFGENEILMSSYENDLYMKNTLEKLYFFFKKYIFLESIHSCRCRCLNIILTVQSCWQTWSLFCTFYAYI